MGKRKAKNAQPPPVEAEKEAGATVAVSDPAPADVADEPSDQGDSGVERDAAADTADADDPPLHHSADDDVPSLVLGGTDGGAAQEGDTQGAADRGAAAPGERDPDGLEIYESEYPDAVAKVREWAAAQGEFMRWDGNVLSATFAASHIYFDNGGAFAGVNVDDDTCSGHPEYREWHRLMHTAAAFVRENPDAPADAIPIHLRLLGFQDLPEMGARELVAWRIFRSGLQALDELAPWVPVPTADGPVPMDPAAALPSPR